MTRTSVIKYYVFMAILSLVTSRVKSIVVLSSSQTSADNISDSSCSPELIQVPTVSIVPLTFNFEGIFPRPWINKSEEFLSVFPEPQKPDVQEEARDTSTSKSQLSVSTTDAEGLDQGKNPTFKQLSGMDSAKGPEQSLVTTTSPKLTKQYPSRQLHSHSPQAAPLSPKPTTGKTVNSVLVSFLKPDPKQKIVPKGYSSSSGHPTKRLSDIINQVRLLRPAFSYKSIEIHSPDTRYSPTETWQSSTQTYDHGLTSTSETWLSKSQTYLPGLSPASETYKSFSHTYDNVPITTSGTRQYRSPTFDHMPTPSSEPWQPTSQTFTHEHKMIADSTAKSKLLNTGTLLKTSNSYPSLATRTQEPSISLLSSLVLNSVTKVNFQSAEDTDTIVYDLTYFDMLDTPLDFNNSTYIDVMDIPKSFNSSDFPAEPNVSPLKQVYNKEGHYQDLNYEDSEFLSGPTHFIENKMFQPYWALTEPPSSTESTTTTENPDLPDFSSQTANDDQSDGESSSAYRLVNIGKSEKMDLTSLEKELQTVLASRLPMAVDADLLNLWHAPYLQRLRHVNHEMVDEILQTDIKTPPEVSECPFEYHDLTRASLQRMLGLLLLSLPQSLKEVEEAIWDQELDTYFFRHQEKNILDVSTCRQCYTRDPLGECREIFFCKNGVAAGAGPRLTPQQIERLLKNAAARKLAAGR